MSIWTVVFGLPFGFLGSYLALRQRTWQGAVAVYVGFLVLGVALWFLAIEVFGD